MEKISYSNEIYFLHSWCPDNSVAESRQFCLMSKTSFPRDIKFNLKMITDNMCQKYFCFHKTTEHIMMYSLEKDLTPLTRDIKLCVVCVFVTIFRCLVVAKSITHDDLCSLSKESPGGTMLTDNLFEKVRCFIYRTYNKTIFNITPEKAIARNKVCGIHTYLFFMPICLNIIYKQAPWGKEPELQPSDTTNSYCFWVRGYRREV